MIATRLQLAHFRNYETLELNFGPGVNVFSGHNAQGKTNILEALYLCSCARSHRTAQDAELIYQGADVYRIDLDYQLTDGTVEQLALSYQRANAALRQQASRQFWHNGAKQARIADLYGLFNAVIFAPEDLALVKEGRRRGGASSTS